MSKLKKIVVFSNGYIFFISLVLILHLTFYINKTNLLKLNDIFRCT